MTISATSLLLVCLTLASGLITIRAQFRDNPQQRYSLDELRNAITVAILSKSWERDQRHMLALALGGYLAKRDVPKHEALELIEELAMWKGDIEHRDRARAVSDSYDRLAKGLPTSGYTALSEIMTAEDLEALGDIWGSAKKIDGDTIISLIESTPESERYSAIVDNFPEISRLAVLTALRKAVNHAN